jgi:hypothetical protein
MVELDVAYQRGYRDGQRDEYENNQRIDRLFKSHDEYVRAASRILETLKPVKDVIELLKKDSSPAA